MKKPFTRNQKITIWGIVAVIIIGIGGWLITIYVSSMMAKSPSNSPCSNSSGNCANDIQGSVTQSITTTSYPSPVLKYEMVMPSEKQRDGSYTTVFDIDIFYAAGSPVPTGTPKWTPSLSCSRMPPEQSAGYAQMTSPYSFGGVMPSEYTCVSATPITDDGKLFTYGN